MNRRFSNLDFTYIGPINPYCDNEGQIVKYFPQTRYKHATTATHNKYGHGPYCKFVIAKKHKKSGVYIITLNDSPVYVGECLNLEKRYSSSGYGGISPRNCYIGGQETNCRINNLIYQTAAEGDELNLWFHEMFAEKEILRKIEATLLAELKPDWNR